MSNNNENNNKRNLEGGVVPPRKRQRIVKNINANKHIGDFDDYDNIVDELEYHINILNNIYTKLIKHIDNKDRYDYYENMYRNEESDLLKLMIKYNLESLTEDFKFNHEFTKLPKEKYFEDYFNSNEGLISEEETEDEESIGSTDTDVEEIEISSTESEDEEKKEDQEEIQTENIYDDIIKTVLNKYMVEGLKEQENYENEMQNKEDDYISRMIKDSGYSKDLKEKLLKENNKMKSYKNTQLPDLLKVLGMDIDMETKAEIMDKIQSLDKSTNEDTKTRTWIKQVMQIPFGKFAEKPVKDTSDKKELYNFIKNFHTSLDKEVYGQKNVKETLMELVTKWLVQDTNKGNCIALSGSAGIGKTTIARSLAKMLNRPFCSFSLAGVSDEQYLSGFSFTYEGATCGRFAKMLMDTKCMNPIIFMDELDKVDTSKSLAVYNKLIEITDFSQNHEIEDHYFGSNIKLDMSQCIFIFSMNNEKLIDPILKDRMEIINVEGFKQKDKVCIAKNFLIPKTLSEYKDMDYSISDENIKYIIQNIEKESGVRNLKRSIDQIFRKVNLLKYYQEVSYKCKNTGKEEITRNMIDKLITKKEKNPILLRMYI
jgi:ATP-dependent Lon protease